MLDLNIASMKAKKGDYAGAIITYNEVILVLKNSTDSSLLKHLLVAMGRIGSLKLKQGDSEGALTAYQEVLMQLHPDSPTFVQMEVARSHIKCAMIYRQDSNTEKAIHHLQQALQMYVKLYGTAHKDTMALQASLRKWQQECQRDNT